MKFTTFANISLASFAIAAPAVASRGDRLPQKREGELLASAINHSDFDKVPEVIKSGEKCEDREYECQLEDDKGNVIWIKCENWEYVCTPGK